MHSRFPRRLVTAALALVFVLALASGAQAAGWQPLGQLSAAGDDAGGPITASAPDGATWVVWEGTHNLEIQRIAADGTKGPVKELTNTFVNDDALVAESNGDALVAWTPNGGGAVNVRQVEPDGTLGTTEPVGDSSATGPIALGIDGSDVATLAFTQNDSTNNVQMLWAQRVEAGAPTGSPIQISTNNKEYVEQLSMATNAAGDSVLAWGYSNFIDNSFPAAWARHIRRLAADGTLGTEHDLGGLQAGSDDYERAAITPSGDAYAAWVQVPTDGGQQGTLHVDKLDSSDTLTPVVASLDDNAASFNPGTDLVTDSSGNLTLLWETVDQSTFDDHLVSRRIDSAGTVSPPLTSDPDALVPLDTAFEGSFTLAELSSGKAAAAWDNEEVSPTVLQSSIIDPSTGPAATDPILSTDNFVETVSIAPDSAGNILLAYDETPDFNHFDVSGAFYDVQGPTIDTFGVPSSGTAGDGMVFGGSASDRSGMQGYAWDFGDGGTATGAIADHTYAAAGTYTVTLTATDNAGNTTTDTQSVTVRPVSSGGGGGGTGGSGSSGSQGPTGPTGTKERTGALVAQLTGLGRTLRLGHGHTLALHLPAQPQDAFGSLTVRTSQGGVHVARLTTIGRRNFQVVHGRQITVRLKLSSRSVKLAKRLHGRLRARLTLELTGFDGKTAFHAYEVTIRT